MNEDNDFYTETMAKVYVNQGYLEKAIDIYTYLLEREPDRKDLAKTLSEIKNRMDQKKISGKEHLVTLFNNWIDLMLQQNKLKKLETVAKSVSRISQHPSND